MGCWWSSHALGLPGIPPPRKIRHHQGVRTDGAGPTVRDPAHEQRRRNAFTHPHGYTSDQDRREASESPPGVLLETIAVDENDEQPPGRRTQPKCDCCRIADLIPKHRGCCCEAEEHGGQVKDRGDDQVHDLPRTWEQRARWTVVQHGPHRPSLRVVRSWMRSGRPGRLRRSERLALPGPGYRFGVTSQITARCMPTATVALEMRRRRTGQGRLQGWHVGVGHRRRGVTAATDPMCVAEPSAGRRRAGVSTDRLWVSSLIGGVLSCVNALRTSQVPWRSGHEPHRQPEVGGDARRHG
jgi:hypothetical protein